MNRDPVLFDEEVALGTAGQMPVELGADLGGQFAGHVVG
jgi:hypothetical protein